MESGNRDPAVSIEKLPLLRVLFEIVPVCQRVGYTQNPESSPQALANLTPHLAESRPAHVEPGQSPLQKIYTIDIIHTALRGWLA